MTIIRSNCVYIYLDLCNLVAINFCGLIRLKGYAQLMLIQYVEANYFRWILLSLDYTCI